MAGGVAVTARRFTTALTVLAVAGFAAGWWVDHRRLELECGVCCPGTWRK